MGLFTCKTKTWQWDNLSYPKIYDGPIIGLGPVLLLCFVSELQVSSSSGLECGTQFCGRGLYSCNLLTETNKFDFSYDLLSCLVSELQKNIYQNLNQGQSFLGLWTLSAVSSSKQTSLVLALFFCHTYFPSDRNHPLQDSKWGLFLYTFLSFVLVPGISIPSLVPVGISVLKV